MAESSDSEDEVLSKNLIKNVAWKKTEPKNNSESSRFNTTFRLPLAKAPDLETGKQGAKITIYETEGSTSTTVSEAIYPLNGKFGNGIPNSLAFTTAIFLMCLTVLISCVFITALCLMWCKYETEMEEEELEITRAKLQIPTVDKERYVVTPTDRISRNLLESSDKPTLIECESAEIANLLCYLAIAADEDDEACYTVEKAKKIRLIPRSRTKFEDGSGFSEAGAQPSSTGATKMQMQKKSKEDEVILDIDGAVVPGNVGMRRSGQETPLGAKDREAASQINQEAAVDRRGSVRAGHQCSSLRQGSHGLPISHRRKRSKPSDAEKLHVSEKKRPRWSKSKRLQLEDPKAHSKKKLSLAKEMESSRSNSPPETSSKNARVHHSRKDPNRRVKWTGPHAPRSSPE